MIPMLDIPVMRFMKHVLQSRFGLSITTLSMG